MAKFIKRLGTKAFKYQTEVCIEKVQVDIRDKCQISIHWQRGPKKIETKTVDFDVNRGCALFKDKMYMGVTLYYDTRTKKYLEKKSKFRVIMSQSTGIRVLGEAEINLASVANLGVQEKEEVLDLTNDPIYKGKLYYNIKLTLLSEITGNESVISAITDKDYVDEDIAQEISITNRTNTPEPNEQFYFSHNSNPPRSTLANRSQSIERIENNFSANSPMNPGRAILQRNVTESTRNLSSSPTGAKPFSKLFDGQPPKGKSKKNILPPMNPSKNEDKNEMTFGKKEKEEEKEKAPSKPEERSPSRLGSKAGERASSSDPSEREVGYNKENKYKTLDAKSEVLKRKITDGEPNERMMKELEMENQRLKEDLNRKDSEVHAAQKKAADKTVELVQIRREIEDLKRENERLSQRQDDGKNVLSRSGEYMELRQQLKEKIEEITMLTQDKEDLLKDIGNLKQNVYQINADKNKEVSKLTQEVRSLRLQNEQLESEKLLSSSRDSQTLASKLAGLDNDKKLEREVESLREQVKSLQSKNMSLEQENKGFMLDSRKDSRGDKEIEGLRSQLEALRKENNNLQQQNQTLDSKYAALDDENLGLRKEVRDLKNHQERNEHERLNLLQENDDLGSKILIALEEEASLKKEVGALKIQLDQAKSESQYLKQENQILSSQVSALEGDDTLMKEIEKLRVQNEDVSKEKFSLQEENQKLQAKVNALETDMSSKHEISKLKEAKEHIEREKAQMQQEIQELNYRVMSISESEKHLKQEMKELKGKNREASSEIDQLKQENEGLLIRISSLEGDNRLSDEVERLQREKEQLVREKLDLKEENIRLGGRVSELEGDNQMKQETEKLRTMNKQNENRLQLLQEENESLSQKVSLALENDTKLRQELKSLKVESERNKRESKKLQEENEELVAKVSAMEKDDRLIKEIENLKTQSVQISKEKLILQKDNETLKAKVSALESDTQAQKEVEKLRKINEEIEREKQELQQENISLSDKANAVLETMKKLKQEIKTLRSENDHVLRENREMKEEIDTLMRKAASPKKDAASEQAKENLERLVEANKGEKAALQEENEGLRSKVLDLEAELKNVQGEFNAQKKANASKVILYDHLVKEKEEILAEKNSYVAEIDKLKEKIVSQDYELQKLRDSVKRVQNDREAHSDRGKELLVQMEELKASFEAEKEALQEKYEDMEHYNKSYIEEVEANMEGLKKELEQAEAREQEALEVQKELSQKLEKLKADYNNLNGEVNRKEHAYATTNDMLDYTKKDFEKEVSRLREKITAGEKSRKTMESEYESRIESQTSELELLKEENSDLISEVKRLKEKLKTKNQSLSKDIDSIKQEHEVEMQQAVKNCEKKDNKIKELSEEINTIRGQINELRNKNNDLSLKLLSTESIANRKVEGAEQQVKEVETLKRKNQELSHEILKLKRELKDLTESKEDEPNLTELILENDNLKKKVKDLNQKLSSQSRSENSAEELEDTKKALKELQMSYRRTEETLAMAKMKLGTSEKQKADLEGRMKVQSEKISKLLDRVATMENEIVKSKRSMGEVLNIVMENCKSDVVDRVQEAMSLI